VLAGIGLYTPALTSNHSGTSTYPSDGQYAASRPRVIRPDAIGGLLHSDRENMNMNAAYSI